MRAPDFVNRRGAGSTRTALLGCALWCALCAKSAAQAPPIQIGDVQLSIPDCEDVAGAEIAKLVALELAPRDAPVPSRAPGAFTHVSVGCAGARATITVADPQRPSALVLELALSATPHEARARFLALAVAELIATSRLERLDADVRKEPQSPPQPPTAAEPAQAPEGARGDRRLTLFLQAGAARALRPARFAPAFAAGVSFAFSAFALVGDLAYERAQMSTPEAVVTAHSASVSAAPAWRITSRRVTLTLALGLRGGYALLGATPRQTELAGHDVSGLFLSPISNASLQWALAPRWAARLSVEFGYVIKPVRGLDADRAALLEVDGPRLFALLGVAFSP